MRGTRLFGALCAVLLCGAGPVLGWSLLEEVRIYDPNLTAQMDYEIGVAKSYCENIPQNLDRLACAIRAEQEFWVGVDAAGSRYGVIKVSDPNGEFFDVLRRQAGTGLSEPVLRITARTEPLPGEVTKLQAAGRWEVDASNGEMTVTLRGDCFTAACNGIGDNDEHLGTIRISGLPNLFTIAATFQPPASMSFRLPAVPEGLPTGSRLDVYTGGIGTLPDFTQAQALECDVAAGLSPGDLITVIDPLPDPAAGQGRYYVAAVTNGPDRRAGRRTEAGALVGRDPSGLPACPGS